MEGNSKEEIGKRLVELQGFLKFKSSRQLANDLGLDPSYFSKAQKGNGLSMEHLNLIISKYDVSRNWLLQ